jgi:inhibitor of cysteine peptidase
MKMKNVYKLWVFLSVFFMSVVSFAAVNTTNINNKSTINNSITTTDPQKPVMVKKSQPVFTIILQSNPTTGFAWSLKNYDVNLIRPVGRVFIPGQRGLIGAGGYEKWTFAVKPAGFIVPQTTSITLIYSRSWELEGAQATNFKVVTINDD